MNVLWPNMRIIYIFHLSFFSFSLEFKRNKLMWNTTKTCCWHCRVCLCVCGVFFFALFFFYPSSKYMRIQKRQRVLLVFIKRFIWNKIAVFKFWIIDCTYFTTTVLFCCLSFWKGEFFFVTSCDFFLLLYLLPSFNGVANYSSNLKYIFIAAMI